MKCSMCGRELPDHISEEKWKYLDNTIAKVVANLDAVCVACALDEKIASEKKLKRQMLWALIALTLAIPLAVVLISLAIANIARMFR